MPPKRNAVIDQRISAHHDADGHIFYIRGGKLDPLYAFALPESHSDITIIDNVPYIRISKKSRILQGLAGVSLGKNEWLDHIQGLRNGLCASAIAEARRVAGYSAWNLGNAKTRNKAYMSKHDAIAELHPPSTVRIDFPAEDSHHTLTMDVLFELSDIATVGVPLRGDILEWICSQVRASGNNSEKGAKRKVGDVPVFDHPEIRWCAQRSSAYVDYLDIDGRKHRHSRCVGEFIQKAEDNDRETAINELGAYLHEFYESHHVPKQDDGDDEPQEHSESCMSADASGCEQREQHV